LGYGKHRLLFELESKGSFGKSLPFLKCHDRNIIHKVAAEKLVSSSPVIPDLIGNLDSRFRGNDNLIIKTHLKLPLKF
jgi:hypothetical protein